MREHEAELERRGLHVVVVTFEAGAVTRNYVRDTALTWPLLVDEDRSLYRAYSMLSAGFWDVWGPRTWLAYARELLRGGHLVASDADTSQRGGDVLVDPEGIVRLHHVGDSPADRPEVATLLELLPSRAGLTG